MASEQKLYGYAPGSYMDNCKSCGQTFMGDKRAWNCEPCAKALSLQADTRPAPAATETGLVTVEYQVEKNGKWLSDHPQSWAARKSNGATVRELCNRSQADELLAELDAECRVLAKRCIEKDARIKELGAENERLRLNADTHQRQFSAVNVRAKNMTQKCHRLERKAEALEAKLAAAEKVRVAAEHVVWFDWSDNDDDAVKAVSDLRAVLEGKPYKCEWQQRAETAETKLEATEKELERLTEFANSFHITVVDNFYKDVTLHLDVPHSLSIRIPNDSTKSFIFKDLEERRRAVLGGKLS